uniref:Uncharacterized protein n=1 Tax=Syphacia muris TaxID=451379 RepID=A0A0N5AV46_9BILA
MLCLSAFSDNEKSDEQLEFDVDGNPIEEESKELPYTYFVNKNKYQSRHPEKKFDVPKMIMSPNHFKSNYRRHHLRKIPLNSHLLNKMIKYLEKKNNKVDESCKEALNMLRKEVFETRKWVLKLAKLTDRIEHFVERFSKPHLFIERIIRTERGFVQKAGRFQSHPIKEYSEESKEE